MSRTVEDILRNQLGSLLMEVAILTAQKEKLEEQAASVKLAVREPDKIPTKEVK